MNSIEPKILLRNENFGGILFNQKDGTLSMLDNEGYQTILKMVLKKTLSESEKKFLSIVLPNSVLQTAKTLQILHDHEIKQLKNAPPITKSPVLIDLSLLNACNLNCDFCYMESKSPKAGSYISLENVKLLVDKMKQGRVLQIALGGGEPTIHPDFISILELIRVKGNIIPNYTTNGTNLTPEILEASKKYCGAVALSYQEFREKELLNKAKKMIDYGIRTNLHIIMLKSRIPKLAEISKKFIEIGVNSIVFLLFKPIGRGISLKDETMTLNDKKEMLFEILKILSIKNSHNFSISFDACSAPLLKDMPFLAESIDGCNGARYSCYVDWNLMSKPCSFMQYAEGIERIKGIDLKENSILEAWNSSLFTKFRENMLEFRYEGCKTCDFFSSCFGGCLLAPSIAICENKKTPL